MGARGGNERIGRKKSRSGVTSKHSSSDLDVDL